MGRRVSRREWLRGSSRFVAALPLGLTLCSKGRATPENLLEPRQKIAAAPPDAAKHRFSSEEDAFLEEVERTGFRYFWEETNPYTGLVKDRSQANGPDARPT